ncbi:MAG: hypothetical protein ACUVXA_15925 [Candidatus Jordarchaeum sp.]
MSIRDDIKTVFMGLDLTICLKKIQVDSLTNHSSGWLTATADLYR